MVLLHVCSQPSLEDFLCNCRAVRVTLCKCVREKLVLIEGSWAFLNRPWHSIGCILCMYRCLLRCLWHVYFQFKCVAFYFKCLPLSFSIPSQDYSDTCMQFSDSLVPNWGFLITCFFLRTFSIILFKHSFEGVLFQFSSEISWAI